MDHLDETVKAREPWKRIEKEFIAEFMDEKAAKDNVLFILGSRTPRINFPTFNVRRFTTLSPLDNLSFDEMADGLQLDCGTVFDRSHGHPLTLVRMLTALEEQGVGLNDFDAVYAALQEGLELRVLQQFFQDVVHTLPDDSRPFLSPTSVLRWINVGPLKSALEANSLTQKGKRDNFYLDIIGEMQGAGIAYWDNKKAAYVIAPQIRPLLERYFELSSPQACYNAHQTAFDYHRQHLKDYPQYVHHCLPEAAYHAGRMTQINNRWSLEHKEEVAEVMNTDYWNGLIGSLKGQREDWKSMAEVLAGDTELKDQRSLVHAITGLDLLSILEEATKSRLE